MTARAVVYYTDNSLPPPLALSCWQALAYSAGQCGAPIVYVGHKPAPDEYHAVPWYWHEVVMGSARRGQAQIYANICGGLEWLALSPSPPEYVYLAEHDCLYLPDHFCGVAEAGGVVYDCHAARLTREGWLQHDRPLLSSCCAPLLDLLAIARERRDRCQHGGRYKWGEFGLGDSLDGQTRRLMPRGEDWTPRVVDVRHGANFTGDRRGNVRPTVPEWGEYLDVWALLGGIPPR